MMPVGIIEITIRSADAYPDVHPRVVWTMVPVRPLVVIMMMMMDVMLVMNMMVFVLMVPVGVAVVS
jgi:hypothetical protein